MGVMSSAIAINQMNPVASKPSVKSGSGHSLSDLEGVSLDGHFEENSAFLDLLNQEEGLNQGEIPKMMTDVTSQNIERKSTDADLVRSLEKNQVEFLTSQKNQSNIKNISSDKNPMNFKSSESDVDILEKLIRNNSDNRIPLRDNPVELSHGNSLKKMHQLTEHPIAEVANESSMDNGKETIKLSDYLLKNLNPVNVNDMKNISTSQVQKLDLSNVDIQQSDVLIDKIVSYIDKHRLEINPNIRFEVEHQDLGKLLVEVSKLNKTDFKVMFKSSEVSASKLLMENKDNFIQKLMLDGIKVSDFIVENLKSSQSSSLAQQSHDQGKEYHEHFHGQQQENGQGTQDNNQQHPDENNKREFVVRDDDMSIKNIVENKEFTDYQAEVA